MIGTIELKLATEDAHRSLENLLSFLHLKPCLRGYQRFLGQTYAYLGTVEPILRSLLPSMEAEGRLEKVSWLEKDLMHMGISRPALIEKSLLPSIQDAQQALGALYVFEGSTLGGTILKKRLQASFAAIPVRYISSYGDLLRRQKWETFKHYFEKQWMDWDKHQQERAKESAIQTFRSFEAWQREGLL